MIEQIRFNTNEDKIKKVMIYFVILLKKENISFISSHEEFEKLAFSLESKYNCPAILTAYLCSCFTYTEDGNLNQLLNYSEFELYNMINEINNKSRFTHTTPKELAELMVAIIDPSKNKKMLDLFSGEGNIEDALYSKHFGISTNGIDNDEFAVVISNLKKVINNYNVTYDNCDINNYEIPQAYYDYCISDIPFIDNSNSKGLVSEVDTPFKRKISFTWKIALRIINSLKNNGRAVITTFDNCLYNLLDKEARQFMVDNNYIESIISLPAGILSYSQVKISLIVFNKNKKSNEIKFIDLSDCYTRTYSRKIVDVRQCLERVVENTINVSSEEIASNDYSFNLKTYSNNIDLDCPAELGTISSDIFRGYAFSTSEFSEISVDETQEYNYKVLEISNIDENGIIGNNFKYINSKDKDFDKYLIKNNDILLSARGSNTKICLVRIKNSERIIANSSIVIIRANSKQINPIYLKMFLDSDKGKKVLSGIVVGVTIPSLNVKDLIKLNVSCPDINIQNKFVDEYSLIAKQIESATKELEKMKKNLREIVNKI